MRRWIQPTSRKALAAIQKAITLKSKASASEQALIEALAQRYSGRAKIAKRVIGRTPTRCARCICAFRRSGHRHALR